MSSHERHIENIAKRDEARDYRAKNNCEDESQIQEKIETILDKPPTVQQVKMQNKKLQE